MKISEVFKTDIFYVFTICLLIGLLAGIFCPKELYVKSEIFIHKLYVKTHPDIQKDSKTLIVEKVTKDLKPVPKHHIFEEHKKDNRFILFWKKIFVKKAKKEYSIYSTTFYGP